MTDHSDWEFFQDEGYFGMWCVRERGVRRFGEGFHTVSKEEAEALASALSSQSLSLSEAREEIERLRSALKPFVDACPVDIIPDLHPMSGTGFGDEWRPNLFVRDFRRARKALENGPAGLGGPSDG